MNEYYVWITLLTPAYSSAIVGRLVKKGFTVGPLNSSCLTLEAKDTPSSIMAVCITSVKDTTKENIHEEVKKALNALKVKYHSIITAKPTDCKWSGSNISLQEIEEIKAKKKQQRSHLTLVPRPVEKETPPEIQGE